MRDSKPFLELKSKLWNIFDILRGQNINTEDYYVVLFLLSLHKDKILKADTLLEGDLIIDQIEFALHRSEGDLKEEYRNIYPNFKPVLKSINEKGLKLIVETICSLNYKNLLTT